GPRVPVAGEVPHGPLKAVPPDPPQRLRGPGGEDHAGEGQSKEGRNERPVRLHEPFEHRLTSFKSTDTTGRGQSPPVTSMVTPVTKSASEDARKQITRA